MNEAEWKRIFGGNDDWWYRAGWLSETESRQLMEMLKTGIVWQQESIRMFGKQVNMPRLTAFYGERGVTYTYSGLRNSARLWEGVLHELQQKLEASGVGRFNSVLLNYYRNGNDSMGWHRDNEKELGDEPVIASVSLGSSRVFKIRPFQVGGKVYSLLPENGSLLVMKGKSQTEWEHAVPKQAGGGERINLTFRWVKY